jgi:release factor glutamine methyltransferase
MTPPQAVAHAERILAGAGAQSPRAEAETLLMAVLGVDRSRLYARREGLTDGEARTFQRRVECRRSGVPVQHLTGRQGFLGLDLEVGPGVFVPRPETEGLVVAALEVIVDRQRPNVVDVGTGTGAVALAVARARPDARVLATDVSQVAVRMARRNAERLGIRIDVREGNLMDPVPADLRGRLDLIVSNPPYVEAEEYEALPGDVRADPALSLVGGTEVHRRLVEAAGAWLAPGGWVAVEIGERQGETVRRMFESRLDRVRVEPDLAGRDRVVVGRLP